MVRSIGGLKNNKTFLQFFHLLAKFQYGENCNNIQLDSFGQIFIKFYSGSTVENDTDLFNQFP